MHQLATRSDYAKVLHGQSVADWIGTPLLTSDERRVLIEQILSDADLPALFSDPIDIAWAWGHAHGGLRIDHDAPLGCDTTRRERDWLRFAWCPDKRECGHRARHAHAHTILNRHREAYTEADAILLEADLTFPSVGIACLPTMTQILRFQPHAPQWLLQILRDTAPEPVINVRQLFA